MTRTRLRKIRVLFRLMLVLLLRVLFPRNTVVNRSSNSPKLIRFEIANMTAMPSVWWADFSSVGVIGTTNGEIKSARYSPP